MRCFLAYANLFFILMKVKLLNVKESLLILYFVIADYKLIIGTIYNKDSLITIFKQSSYKYYATFWVLKFYIYVHILHLHTKLMILEA